MTDGNSPVNPIDPKGCITTGISKREEFAKAAMVGILSGLWSATDGHGWNEKEIAEQAVRQADALIEALNKKP